MLQEAYLPDSDDENADLEAPTYIDDMFECSIALCSPADAAQQERARRVRPRAGQH